MEGSSSSENQIKRKEYRARKKTHRGNNCHHDYCRHESGRREERRNSEKRSEAPKIEFDVLKSSTESEPHETVLEIVEVIFCVEGLGDGLKNAKTV
jgi:hypothetical protein